MFKALQIGPNVNKQEENAIDANFCSKGTIYLNSSLIRQLEK